MRSGFSRKVLQSDGTIGSPEKPANRNDKNTRSFPLMIGRSLLHIADVFRLRQIVRKERVAGSGGGIIFFLYFFDQIAACSPQHWLGRGPAPLALSLAPRPAPSSLPR